jgi:hypothetical protein
MIAFSAPASATVFGGVDFPEGAVSFADSIVSYSPGGGGLTAPHQGTFNALGTPNYAGSNSCASQASCSFVSLGDGGSIVARFLENVLTGSDSAALDLWIFEVGPDIEDMFVDISSDGITWLPVGAIGGATAGVDLDFFGYGSSSSFSYVRLTDDTTKDGQSGPTVGADIDAIGAISTRVTSGVPEPATWALMLVGFGAVGASLRSRRRARLNLSYA